MTSVRYPKNWQQLLCLGFLLGFCPLPTSVATGQNLSEAEELFPDINNFDSHDYKEWIAKYIVNATKEDIEFLKTSEIPSIRIAATWESVLRDLPNSDNDSFDAAKKWQFIGFLEAIVRTPPPQRWTDFVVKGRHSRRRTEIPPAFEASSSYFEKGGRFLGSKTDVIDDGDRWILVKESDSTSVTKASVISDLEAMNADVFNFGDVYFLVCSERNGNVRRVYAIDRKGETCKWKSSLWGGGAPTYDIVRGPILQEVYVVLVGESVVFFGASRFGFYVESLNLETGFPECRFGSRMTID
jgi:hypothetical protein